MRAAVQAHQRSHASCALNFEVERVVRIGQVKRTVKSPIASTMSSQRTLGRPAEANHVICLPGRQKRDMPTLDKDWQVLSSEGDADVIIIYNSTVLNQKTALQCCSIPVIISDGREDLKSIKYSRVALLVLLKLRFESRGIRISACRRQERALGVSHDAPPQQRSGLL